MLLSHVFRESLLGLHAFYLLFSLFKLLVLENFPIFYRRLFELRMETTRIAVRSRRDLKKDFSHSVILRGKVKHYVILTKKLKYDWYAYAA